MPGIPTNGLPDPTVADGTLPLPSTARLAVDTRLPGGAYPQSLMASPQQLGAASNGAVLTLTDGASIAYDASLGSMFSVTLGGNRTLVISNAAPGQLLVGKITQDGTGSRTMAVTGALTSGTPLSTGASKVDLVGIKVLTATTFLYYPIAKDFA